MKTISLDLAESRLLVEYRINRVPSPDLIKVIDRLEMFVASNIPSPAGVVPEKEFTPTEIKGGVPKSSYLIIGGGMEILDMIEDEAQ